MGDSKILFIITLESCGACQNLKKFGFIEKIKELTRVKGYKFINIHFKGNFNIGELINQYHFPPNSVELIKWFPCYVKKDTSGWHRFGDLKNGQIIPAPNLENLGSWLSSDSDGDGNLVVANQPHRNFLLIPRNEFKWF